MQPCDWPAVYSAGQELSQPTAMLVVYMCFAQQQKLVTVHVSCGAASGCVLQTAGAKKGGVLAAMRQLADGHWVLAFGSADKAALAVTMVQQHATRLQGLYREALAPLCQDAPQQLHQTGQPDQQPNTQQQQQHNRLLQADCEKDAAAAAGAQQSDADEQHLQAEGLAGDMARASLGGSVGQ